VKYLRTRQLEPAANPVEVTFLTDRLAKAEHELQESQSVNAKLHKAHSAAVRLLREVSLQSQGDFVECLVNENRLLEMENKHVRDLLLLATHDFSPELAQESIKSSASEASSFLLTTPPRSPVHNIRNNSRRIFSANKSAVTSPSRPTQMPPVPSARFQPPSLIVGDLDVADVGPPMSPPPNASPREIRRLNQPPPKDPNDAQDAQDAQEGAEEVDHDLSM
jgi:hypothetical protein